MCVDAREEREGGKRKREWRRSGQTLFEQERGRRTKEKTRERREGDARRNDKGRQTVPQEGDKRTKMRERCEGGMRERQEK